MQHDFPVDLPGAPPPDAHSFGWTASIITITALGLLLTNAISLSDWGAELTPSPAVVRFVNIADRWHAITERTGLGAPRKGVHAVWKKLEAARFPGQEAAPEAKPAG